MNEIMKLKGINLTNEQMEAVELHNEIIKNGNDAATALVNLSVNLKKMRDSKQYIHLGYDSFEEYVEEAAGIKQTQAYTYIQVVEKLGIDDLQLNAKYGITKLKLLTELPSDVREDMVENGDLDSMSTRELKELVKQLTNKYEQLSLVENENVELKKELEEFKADDEETYSSMQEELTRLKNENAELLKKPTDVTAVEMDDKEIKRIKKEAAKEAADKEKEKADKKIKQLEEKKADEIKKAVAAAEKKAKEEAAKKVEEDYKSTIESIRLEKESLATKTEELTKKLKVSSNPNLLKFSYLCDSLKQDVCAIGNVLKDIEVADPDVHVKLKTSMIQFGETMKKMFEE